MKAACIFGWVVVFMAATSAAEFLPENAPDGWTVESPRDEIQPLSSYEPNRGPNGTSYFVMSAEGSSETMGQWTAVLPVVGSKPYRFSVLRKTINVETPRRNTFVRITWQDSQGELVMMGPGDHLSIRSSKNLLAKGKDVGSASKNEDSVSYAWEQKARYEFPADHATDANGWTELSDIYLVPPDATQAKVELYFRSLGRGEVRWSEVSLKEVAPPESRKVRLASINLHVKKGGPQSTPLDACRQFADLIAEAAEQNADIVCLPEELTYVNMGKEMEEVAESIPGPCSNYFGELAKKHDLYIVAGLVERDGPHIYNTAALIGPDGSVVGKYHKVCLTRNESAKGFASGQGYPVFETRFGKVGMMICWDLMFPEAARSLSNHGAEIIALPIAGGDPILARARAIENQIYLVTSSLGGHGLESGVFGYDGSLLGEATDSEGSVCVVEVDLNQRQYWYWLGNLKNEIQRARPPAGIQE